MFLLRKLKINQEKQKESLSAGCELIGSEGDYIIIFVNEHSVLHVERKLQVFLCP